MVFKGVNNTRKAEYDVYRERKRALTLAANSDPRSAAKFAELAQFMLDESQQLHGNTGYGYKAFFSFRVANPPAEQSQAIDYCDQALQLDPRNAQAHAVKAGALLELGQDDPAGVEIAAALQIAPGDPKVLKLVSNLMTKASWANISAGDQYSAPTITEDAEYVYIHSRSDSDLAQARYFYGLANQQLQTATNSLQAAARSTQGTGDSFYYAAALAIRAGDKDAAVADMTRAVELSPDNSYYHMYLGKLDTELHRPDMVVVDSILHGRQHVSDLREQAGQPGLAPTASARLRRRQADARPGDEDRSRRSARRRVYRAHAGRPKRRQGRRSSSLPRISRRPGRSTRRTCEWSAGASRHRS